MLQNLEGSVTPPAAEASLPCTARSLLPSESPDDNCAGQLKVSTAAPTVIATPHPPAATMQQQPQQPPSPDSPSAKEVSFELLIDEGMRYHRARLPLRVRIFPHDTTDSIITTVKNFYGLYDGTIGVSFEEEEGHTLIARYENFRNNMTVYVRVVMDYSYTPPMYGKFSYQSLSRAKPPSLDEPFQMLQPPPYERSRPSTRPNSRIACNRSISPISNSSRRTQKSRSHSVIKGRTTPSCTESSSVDPEGYSSDEVTVASSRRARSEQLASAEISLDNILTDGESRRGRVPKFSSSELPLFPPPQVPGTASTPSISPQRRSLCQDAGSPFVMPVMQHGFARPYVCGDQMYTVPVKSGNGIASIQPTHNLRDHTNVSYSRPFGQSQGILPTPDPTIASCISDEDVALQLMRLGDASNISSHGHMSTSTMDDNYSGVADLASSNGAISENGDGNTEQESYTLPPQPTRAKTKPKASKKQSETLVPTSDTTDPSLDDAGDDDYIDKAEASIKGQREKCAEPQKQSRAKSKAKSANTVKSRNVSKATKSTKLHYKRSKIQQLPVANGGFKLPASPSNLPVHSRKQSTPATSSNIQRQLILADDDDDLSTKPRCQRCRKSKKGCDRQRPCQRCKDAGIGIEGCISEDEGNGRKGRYGRHMGISVKRKAEVMAESADAHVIGTLPAGVAGATPGGDQINKRRKK